MAAIGLRRVLLGTLAGGVVWGIWSTLINLVILPQYILSGVFFASKNFPDAVQPFIKALPLTQLIDALREVMLEGKSLWEVSWHIAILAAYAAVSFTLALRWFKWQ